MAGVVAARAIVAEPHHDLAGKHQEHVGACHVERLDVANLEHVCDAVHFQRSLLQCSINTARGKRLRSSFSREGLQYGVLIALYVDLHDVDAGDLLAAERPPSGRRGTEILSPPTSERSEAWPSSLRIGVGLCRLRGRGAALDQLGAHAFGGEDRWRRSY